MPRETVSHLESKEPTMVATPSHFSLYKYIVTEMSSAQIDNLWCNQWRQFYQNDISVSG